MSAPATRRSVAPALRRWLGGKGPVLKFVGVFAVLMAIFYGIFYRPPTPTGDSVSERIINGYLVGYAGAAGRILNTVGYDVRVDGATMSDRRSAFSVRVVRGCDAMEATALFVFGVASFPVGRRRKVIGIVVGVLLLALLNLFRICTLYAIGVHSHRLFELMHIDVWQALFILITISLWLVWLRWAMRPEAAHEMPAHDTHRVTRAPRPPVVGLLPAVDTGSKLPVAPADSIYRRIGGFLLRFFAIYAVMLLAWPAAAGVYRPMWRYMGDVLFSSVGETGSAVYRPQAAAVGTLDTLIILRAKGAAECEMDSSSLNVGYMPTMTLMALVLASPLAWPRRMKALAIGLVLVNGFVALRMLLGVWEEFASPGLPVQQFHLGPFWQRGLEQINVALVDSPASFFVVPIFIWIVVAFRRGDWSALGGAAAPSSSPGVRATGARTDRRG